MKWFQGSIADAVTSSKASNAIFVVFVEGEDEMSKAMNSALNYSNIASELSSSKFVCIKLTKDSESHHQFTEIYKIVPVPSLFFIGENGVPLEIVAGDKSCDSVSNKIVTAISKIKGVPMESVPSSARMSTNKASSSTEAVSGSGSSRETTPISSTPATKEVPQQETESSKIEKESEEAVHIEKSTADKERVQDLIKKKREENRKIENEKEKERELARREMGKELNLAKRSQQERELEEMRREREKERRLEAEARQRVLRQIEEDKANRAAKLQQNTVSAQSTPPTSQQSQRPASPPIRSNEGRIQFKLPDGQTKNQTFPSTTTIKELRIFVDSNIDVPFREYTLATMFPRREFVNRDLDLSLIELELLPSCVILILPVQGGMGLVKGGGWVEALTVIFWSLVQPILNMGTYLRNLVMGGGTQQRDQSETQEDSDPPQHQPQADPASDGQPVPTNRSLYGSNLGAGKSVRRRGNVHTLSDGNDSNDENNTWNGNSTQLM